MDIDAFWQYKPPCLSLVKFGEDGIRIGFKNKLIN